MNIVKTVNFNAEYTTINVKNHRFEGIVLTLNILKRV